MAKNTTSQFTLPEVPASFQEVSNILSESARKFGDLNVASASDTKEAITKYASSFDFTSGKTLDVKDTKDIYTKHVSFLQDSQERVARYWSDVFALSQSVSDKLTGAFKVV